MTIEELLEGRRVCICAGSGGVGKTTASAAIAMGMAAAGRKVAVVTIDPARRLANSLGLDSLGNEPRLVDPARFAGHGIEMRGELWAMMLDPKATFDELIERLAPDAAAREEILSNRIYQELSGAVAGSQEYTAIAKLYELDQEGDYDLLVLDTPPSRNALDFLDAPGRLTQFFEGRALRVFLRPGGVATRIVGAGTGLVFSILKRVTGVDLLEDLSVFFRALGGLIDGFKERADHASRLLADPATTFLLVTSPEPEPVEEAIYFWTKLAEAKMPFGGVIVNRVNVDAAPGADPAAVEAELARDLPDALAAKVAACLADQHALAAHDRASIARLDEALGGPPRIDIPAFDDDIHDVDGLVAVHRHLAGTAGGGAI
ncbi:MAG: ArsA family ATPase [Solirubrobacteraceae bacterium]